MKRVLLFFILLLPLIFASYELFVIENVKDPIKYIYTFTGTWALVILFFTITISLIKKWINLLKYRKMIGLFGFFYSLLHFMNFFILDAELSISFVVKESLDKPFIYLGMISFLLLIFMAITSKKTLYVKYNNYHKVVYLALILSTIHFIMAQKSLDLLQFSYILIILIISYFKLLQQILKKNKI